MSFHTPTDSIEIPNKSVFTTDEVCSLTGVKPYVLRFWENEFPEISPILSTSGKKLFEHKDIEAIVVVKKLLYEEKLPVERAKMELGLRLQRTLPDLPTDPEDEDMEETLTGPQSGRESSEAFQYRRWDEEDIKKLTEAKKRLQNLLERTNSAKGTHHWN